MAAANTMTDVPPPPERVIEGMLFIGGIPLPPHAIAERLRGMDEEQVAAAVSELNRRYKSQGRPYHVTQLPDGYVMALRPSFRQVRERMQGAVREARLSPHAIEVLAIVAYRQPIAKDEVDSLRGSDSGPLLRQLARHGLVQVSEEADSITRYATTPRFLELFQLPDLADLPRTADLDRL